ncbi:MAG TPA: TrkH family potassium uptake protein [Atribacteraceae bacterium]|nr:TrkH family potassium uptake protein [Atribacteraceae bacterium]
MGLETLKKRLTALQQLAGDNKSGFGNLSDRIGGLIHRLSPAYLILFGYAMIILIGALLLSLPSMVTAGNRLTFIDALFTSASAICVTGLIVVDTATFFSPLGQVVILILIQAGGLGYMTFSTILALIFRRRIEYRDRLAIKESLSLIAPGGVVRFTITIIKYTFFVEMIGASLLFMAFVRILPPGRAFFSAIFHAVSAFCNAGFSVFSTNLEGFSGDPLVILVVMALFILGGIGFIVMAEVIHRKRDYSLHVQVVIRTTVCLIALGTGLILLFEWNNPETLGALSFSEKIMNSLFQSSAPRTAGFHTLPIGAHTPPTLFLMIGLMFIGASPGGTGGGVKTTVLALVLGLVLSTLQGKSHVEIARRRISPVVLNRAISLVVMAVFFLLGIIVVILSIQPLAPMPVIFEVFSAFGTVGLSMGITAELASFSKFLIIITMYVGRVGFFSLLMLRWHKERQDILVFPEENIAV